MKYFEMLLTTGNNAVEALQLMQQKIITDYANKQARIAQMFLLQEAQVKSSVAVGPNGQPAMQLITNLVVIMEEETELDNLQRNYKPVFDYMNNNREAFINILIGWMAAVSGSVPLEAVDKLKESAALKQKPYNE